MQNKPRMVRLPQHPNANSQGYILEHRLVMSRILGRPLKRSDVVHHISGDKTDNRAKNLALMTTKSHLRWHSQLGRMLVSRSSASLQCCRCEYMWAPLTDKVPVSCPRCKSYRWETRKENDDRRD